MVKQDDDRPAHRGVEKPQQRVLRADAGHPDVEARVRRETWAGQWQVVYAPYECQRGHVKWD